MKFKVWLILFIFSLFLSCTDDDYPVTLEVAQAQRLLTNDSSKVWIPVTGAVFSDCATDDQYKFTRSTAKDKLGEYTVHPGAALCENESETKGTWEVIQSDNGANQLRIHTSETNVYQIDLITASQLRILDSNQEVMAFIAKP